MKNNTKSLEEVCEIIMGQSPSSDSYNSTGNGLPFFQGKSEFGEVFPTAVKWCSSPGKIAQAGDILISVRAPVGPTNLAKEKCCIGRGLAAIRPYSGKIDRDFLLLQLQYLENYLVKKGQGSTFESIGTSELTSLQIYTPEVAIQHRIAVHLNAQLTDVTKARKAAEEQWKEVQNLANAIISDSIRRGKTINHKLGDVLNEIKKGIGESWKAYPVLGATRNGMALAKEPPGQYPYKYKPVVPGTVFYNPMRILIGSIAFMDKGDEPGITSPDYVVLQGKEGLLDSRWFYYWLRSPLGEQCINSLARGAVRERMLFNRLAEGEIELPDFSIQKRASESLKELVNIKKTIKKQLDEIKLIPNKLLAQAFNIE
jgi:type I restriction enzyme S subunit